MDVSALKISYDDNKKVADDFREALVTELDELLERASLPIAIPIEGRTKDWQSITIAIDRKSLNLNDIKDLRDLVGLRLVFLFSADVERAKKLILKSFERVEEEDKGELLRTSEFGYKSIHYNVWCKKEWNERPSFKRFKPFHAEIQIRTLAQHTWAVASHVLQYKKESDVPQSVDRSIHRLAAVLEGVDKELEQVKKQKADYIRQLATLLNRDGSREHQDRRLNVDLLAGVLNKWLPAANKAASEPYASLFHDLERSGIHNVKQLKALIGKYLPKARKNDAAAVRGALKGELRYSGGDLQMIKRGVFYNHVGLVQNMLNEKLGKNWRLNPKMKLKSSNRGGANRGGSK